MVELPPPALIRHGRVTAPLSFAQERLWFLDAAAPGSATYNVPLLLRWSEPVDAAALAVALRAVADKHEVLRTTYRVREGSPEQVVGEARVPVEVVDVASTGDGWDEVRADALRRGREPFDLAGRPPVRCVVWHGLPGGDAVLLTVHHIALDGWSLAALFDDLSAAYDTAVRGGRPTLAPPPVQYADFARWDRDLFAEAAPRARLAERVEQLLAVPADLTLGAARPAAASADRPGAQHPVAVPAAVWAGVGELAGRLRATPFVVLLAAFQVVLQRWSGRDEFLVGTVAANRPHPDLERLVGFFVNTVPLRCRLDPEWTFAELCRRVRTEAFGALSHQKLPYDQVTAAARGAGRANLVDVGFALQNMPPPAPSGRWASPELLPTGTAKFDVTLVLEEGPDGLGGFVEHALDRYPEGLGRQLAENFQTVLAAAVADPESPVARLPIAPAGARGVLVGERRDLAGERLARLGATAPDTRVTSILDVLDAQFAAADPDAPAVTAGGVSLTWSELDRWSWRVAELLSARGVGVGDRVPVIGARGGALVAAWLGTLRAGAAYVPLSLDTPAHRLAFIVGEVAAKTVLIDRAGAEVVRGSDVDAEFVAVEDVRAVDGTPPAPIALTGAEPAVVIYTSGTTGRPKGVLVPHRGLLNTAIWWGDELGPHDRLLCTWSTSFDGATFDTFRTLAAGAHLVFADDVERRDPRALLRLVRGRGGATVTAMTPSLLRAMLDADDPDAGPTTLRAVHVGGEALPRTLAAECTGRWGVPMRNVYGPTEASCVSTYAPVDLTEVTAPAIGVPLPNTRAYVLGPHGEELPAGAPGELCVAGIGVALGYLGQPDRTAVAFVPDPYGDAPDSTMYRTGDRVVLRPNGLLEYLGRVDDQVKILGNRIEPNEVRTLLEEQPAVRAAAVHATGEPKRLVAHVELADPDGPLPSRDAVVRPLLRWLPAAVLPAEVYAVAALPLTANDKLDVAALAGLPSRRLADAVAGARELTAGERDAAALFTGALGAPAALGPDADFFALGGHSLLAVKMLVAAERRHGVAVPLREFLGDPTVAGLARLLAAGAPETAGPAELDEVQPSTDVQQRFWFIDRVPELRAAYLAPAVLELTGRVDVEALRHAVERVLARHPALRSRFTLDRALRRVAYRTDGAPPPVTVVEDGTVVENVTVVEDGTVVENVADDLAARCWTPFDLATEAPARAAILTGPDRTLLVLTVHHIVIDGWAQQVLLDQIAALYRGGDEAGLPAPVHPATLTAPPPPAGRVAAVVAGLRGAPTDVALPHDRPRPRVQRTEGATREIALDAAVTAGLRALAGELGCSTFMVTAALLAATLARRSEQRDFLFAFPWAGRDAAGSAHAVGMFVNTLVLRADLRGEPTWRELLGRIRDASLAAYRGADTPFDAVAAALHPDRDLARPPLTPVYLSAVEQAPAPPDLGPGVAARFRPLPALRVKYELELTATGGEDALRFAAAYATAVFDDTTITELLETLVDSATSLVTNPDAGALAAAAPTPDGDDLLAAVRQRWCEVLDVADVPLDLSFFEAGGDSLLLIVLLERLEALTDRELSAADLFQHSTVTAQAALLAGDDTPAAPTGEVRGARDRHLLAGRARRDGVSAP